MSRHTQPMTDAYMTGQRMRNEARAQCKIEQLGDRWLLHPDNALTRDQHIEFRRSRTERIDTSRLTSRLEAAGFCSASEAFRRALEGFSRVRFPLLLEHEGGAQ